MQWQHLKTSSPVPQVCPLQMLPDLKPGSPSPDGVLWTSALSKASWSVACLLCRCESGSRSHTEARCARQGSENKGVGLLLLEGIQIWPQFCRVLCQLCLIVLMTDPSFGHHDLQLIHFTHVMSMQSHLECASRPQKHQSAAGLLSMMLHQLSWWKFQGVPETGFPGQQHKEPMQQSSCDLVMTNSCSKACTQVPTSALEASGKSIIAALAVWPQRVLENLRVHRGAAASIWCRQKELVSHSSKLQRVTVYPPALSARSSLDSSAKEGALRHKQDFSLQANRGGPPDKRGLQIAAYTRACYN